jgi:transposase InsO family protein
LNKNSIRISITHGASPQQNAIAERINGILKNEWLNDFKLKDVKDAKRKLKGIIEIYNTVRPHQTLNYSIPSEVHLKGFFRHPIESILIGKQYMYKKKVQTIEA